VEMDATCRAVADEIATKGHSRRPGANSDTVKDWMGFQFNDESGAEESANEGEASDTDLDSNAANSDSSSDEDEPEPVAQRARVRPLAELLGEAGVRQGRRVRRRVERYVEN
jgi:hypothetical protein